MIIFHEGMPRQGKSYAAMKDHIIVTLRKRRKVYARLDGADDAECRAKVAELAGLTVEELDQLYIHLTPEQVREIWKLELDNDALIVIDELQNYWPQRRQPLDDGLRIWIAEHGHHGWDLLTMGQVLSECHKTWVNRTNRKIQFQKKDVVGKPNEYKWTMFLGKPDQNGVVKFTEISKGDGVYEEQYFGTYKSHSVGTENTDTYEDDRVNIWKSPIFRKWLPIFGLVFICAIGYLIYFFKGGMVPAAQAKPVKVVETVTTSGPGQEEMTVTRELRADGSQVKPADIPKEKEAAKEEGDMPDYIADLSKEHKIRLGMVMHSAKGTSIIVEWRDSSMRVIESLRVAEIEVLGWRVMHSTNDRMVMLVRPGQKLVATAWPIEETTGKVTVQQKDEIRGSAPKAEPT